MNWLYLQLNKINSKMAIAIRVSDKLVNEARKMSKIERRSVTGQIEFWAQIGKIAEENPDLPYGLIKEILIGMEELIQGDATEYNFG
jgi:hypothetical protein